MSPETLCAVARPSRTDSTRRSPDTVFDSMEAPTDWALTSPDTVCTRSSRPTRSRRTSPLTVFTVASRSISPLTTRSPDADFASSDARRPRTFMSAEAVVRTVLLPCGTFARTRRRALPKLKSPIEIVIPNAFLLLSSTTMRRPSWRTSVRSISLSSPSSDTSDSSPSTVSMSMSPDGMLTTSSTGPGVWKRWSVISRSLRGRRDGDGEPDDLAVFRLRRLHGCGCRRLGDA